MSSRQFLSLPPLSSSLLSLSLSLVCSFFFSCRFERSVWYANPIVVHIITCPTRNCACLSVRPSDWLVSLDHSISSFWLLSYRPKEIPYDWEKHFYVSDLLHTRCRAVVWPWKQNKDCWFSLWVGIPTVGRKICIFFLLLRKFFVFSLALPATNGSKKWDGDLRTRLLSDLPWLSTNTINKDRTHRKIGPRSWRYPWSRPAQFGIFCA